MTEAEAVLTTTLVAIGGALGSVARYWIATWAMPIGRSLPWGTILINIVGSFAIGFFGTFTLAHGRYPVPESARVFFMVGVCGGFTTFSSFSLQTLDLLRAGSLARALMNIGLSVTLCLASVALGHTAGAALNGGAANIVQTAKEEETS